MCGSKAALVGYEGAREQGNNAANIGEQEADTGGFFNHLLTIVEVSGVPSSTGVPATWILAGAFLIAMGMILAFIYCVMR